MPDNIINFLVERKGLAIFFEAGFLFFINYFLFGNHESIINSIDSRYVKSATDISAILTVLLLSLGFIYYIGYFIAAKLWKVDINIGGGPLSQLILPYGAIFLLAIFILPLMIYLSSSQFSDIRKFIIINFGFVFIVGFINEFIIQYLSQIRK